MAVVFRGKYFARAQKLLDDQVISFNTDVNRKEYFHNLYHKEWVVLPKTIWWPIASNRISG